MELGGVAIDRGRGASDTDHKHKTDDTGFRKMSQLPAIAIHGGAWAIPDPYVDRSVAGVKTAAKVGYDVLLQGGSAVDAVEAAVKSLEDDPIFNAGTGSSLNSRGEVEMDSMIMDGRTLSAGAVASVQNIQHPVQLARLVMDKSDHTLLVGQGASEFGKEMGLPQVPAKDLCTEGAWKELEQFLKYKSAVAVEFKLRDASTAQGHDTVGAVAVDKQGNVASATSTGGITHKRPGRVGDSPLIGCGGYADNEAGAVSSTGHGEAITRVCLAHKVTSLMKQGRTAQEAAEAAIGYMGQRVQGCGGVIAVGPQGELGQHFSSERMAWAMLRNNELRYGIEPLEDNREKLTV